MQAFLQEVTAIIIPSRWPLQDLTVLTLQKNNKQSFAFSVFSILLPKQWKNFKIQKYTGKK